MTGAGFVAHVSRARTGLMLVGALGFVAAGTFLAAQSDPRKQLVGAAAIALFGLFALIAGRQLLRAGPVIEIDARGIRWRRWSDDTIPWNAIERAKVRSMKSQRFLCLWLRDPAAHRSTRLLGRLAGANRTLGFGDIALVVQGTDRAFAELVDAVAAYRAVEGRKPAR